MAGRKIDIIKRNNRVCFEFDILDDILTSEQACRWGAKYKSVIGSGTVEILDTVAAKRDALEWIMHQYGSGTWDFDEKILNETLVLRVQILEINGKART
jgi:nitroimidazol reductase NimA-like FMN-containing flavoprotein (pyridoxamine 5'-phosphate oxidase superfamily)